MLFRSPDHTYTANAYYTMANVLLGLGRLDEAREHALKASRIRETVLGRQNQEYWNAELTVARIELRSDNRTEARDLLRRLIGDIEMADEPNEGNLETAKRLLAEASQL